MAEQKSYLIGADKLSSVIGQLRAIGSGAWKKQEMQLGCDNLQRTLSSLPPAPEPLVIVHKDKRDEYWFHTFGGADLLIVDDNAPDDWVYRWTEGGDAEFAARVLAADIGSAQDDRHEAIKHKVLRFMEGRPHLEPLPSLPKETTNG